MIVENFSVTSYNMPCLASTAGRIGHGADEVWDCSGTQSEEARIDQSNSVICSVYVRYLS